MLQLNTDFGPVVQKPNVNRNKNNAALRPTKQCTLQLIAQTIDSDELQTPKFLNQARALHRISKTQRNSGVDGAQCTTAGVDTFSLLSWRRSFMRSAAASYT